MDRREVAFDPSILSIIADQRQMSGAPVALGEVSKSGTYQLWRQARDLVEELLVGRQREVLLLFLARKSFSEIARTLGISKSSVQYYYEKGIGNLRRGSVTI